MHSGGFCAEPHLFFEILLHIHTELDIFPAHFVSRVEGMALKIVACNPLQSSGDGRYGRAGDCCDVACAEHPIQ